MIKDLRERYNQNFTSEKYDRFLQDIKKEYDHLPDFRLCETPVFIPDSLKEHLLEACDDIKKLISRSDFKELTKDAFKDAAQIVPGEDDHTCFLQMDFGITRNEEGELYPQLIELQGFPSLYFFQDQLSEAYRKNFDIPQGMTPHPLGQSRETYLQLMKKLIVGSEDPKNVVLLEVEPEKQNTRIDFYATADKLGVKILCITRLKKEGKKLYYLDEQGEKVAVKRIYNRVIFDELDQRDDLKREFDFKDELDVEWVGHPSWFFRISKYILPLFDSPYVPKTYYLENLDKYPDDLENYVLKPLYSFAGSGIILDLTAEILDGVKDRENYILQRKVEYAPVIETPTGPAKCEIRMMMVWEKDRLEGELVNNLIRITKGRMVGVKYNLNKDWVGASVGFFQS